MRNANLSLYYAQNNFLLPTKMSPIGNTVVGITKIKVGITQIKVGIAKNKVGITKNKVGILPRIKLEMTRLKFDYQD